MGGRAKLVTPYTRGSVSLSLFHTGARAEAWLLLYIHAEASLYFNSSPAWDREGGRSSEVAGEQVGVHGGGHEAQLDVAAHVDIESKVECNRSFYSFKRLDPGAFTVGLMGSTCICTAQP
jgi:hypothetical protein